MWNVLFTSTLFEDNQ